MRVDKQSQAKEHDDLRQPGQSVHKGVDILTVHDFIVSHHDTGDIYGKVSVTFQ